VFLCRCILRIPAALHAKATRTERGCAFAPQMSAFYPRARLAPYGQYNIMKDSLITVLVDLAFVFGWKRLE
jgi:hypothetical protein